MKAKRIKLTAATLSAFLGLSGLGLSQAGGSTTTQRNTAVQGHRSSQKAHKGGKKGHHKGRKRGHKGGKKSKKGSASTTPPPK